MEAKEEAIVYMKVGDHAGEPWEKILERKIREIEEAQVSFWGYGGSVCHPITQIQPFARKHTKVRLLMEFISSIADPKVAPARSFSHNGIEWFDIPDGVSVTGSRYAIILGSIKKLQYPIPLNMDVLRVGVGLSEGRPAADYLKGRVDKGCFVGPVGEGSSTARYAGFDADIIAPYAVMLRGEEANRQWPLDWGEDAKPMMPNTSSGFKLLSAA